MASQLLTTRDFLGPVSLTRAVKAEMGQGSWANPVRGFLLWSQDWHSFRTRYYFCGTIEICRIDPLNIALIIPELVAKELRMSEVKQTLPAQVLLLLDLINSLSLSTIGTNAALKPLKPPKCVVCC